jgi:2-dehydro-3-deoxyphosphogluconate aldolase/(4S)-4-hydroxy-2-oxoglutarate aldolase
MKAPFSQALFQELPIVGILRGFTPAQTTEIVRAAIGGGLRNIEITMNTPDAARQLREAATIAEGQLNIGAGTVINLELLDQALAAGAAFIVTPTVEPKVVVECVKRKIPVFPGALSPTEIVRAWDLGAMMVKVFPAESVGPGYIRALKAPLPHIKLLPTGGVDLTTLREFLKAGADGFGIGSPLFDRQRVQSCDWTWVEAQCRAFMEAYRQSSTLHSPTM